MGRIEIRAITNRKRWCNTCERDHDLINHPEKGGELRFELLFGATLITVCPDCLDDLMSLLEDIKIAEWNAE